MDNKKKLELILNGVVDCIPLHELEKKLQLNIPLKIKLGMDPTAPDLHLGHAVVLRKLREFQILGHEIILIIGDYTAKIGDPTGKTKTRPPLTDLAIKKNSETYLQQVGKILDINKVQIKYNSEWLSQLNFSDLIKLCSKVTVARILERDDFTKRLNDKKPVSLHEILYPIMQGYDSVFLQADVELGGTDQTFNLLFGRFLQEQFAQSPQVIITTPLLEGLDGVEKMSKSLGNSIGLIEAPNNVYGKLLSISDVLMWRYYKLLLNYLDADIESMKAQVATEQVHPLKLKKQLAFKIISLFWSETAAQFAAENFDAVFKNKDYSNLNTIKLNAIYYDKKLWIVELLKLIHAVSSTSEAKRLIDSNSVRIDSELITDFKLEVKINSGMIIKVGKIKIYKIE